MTTYKHCGVTYTIIEEYSDSKLYQIIEINGNKYKIEYYPRPCNKVSDLYAVIYKGVRFSTFAKLLKYLNTL